MKQYLLMLLSEAAQPVFSTIVEVLDSELHKLLQSLTDAHPQAVRGIAVEAHPDRLLSKDEPLAADVQSAVI